MMDIDKAYCILTNKKKYWSHEVEEAKKYAEKAFVMIALLPEFAETRPVLQRLLDGEFEKRHAYIIDFWERSGKLSKQMDIFDNQE